MFKHSKYHTMRKILHIILLSLLAALCVCGCRRASDNGKLDGFWRIDNIHYTDTEEDISPTGLFIAVNLELIQLDNPGPNITGVLTYKKGDDRIAVDFPTNPSATSLRTYGFSGNPALLDIEKVSAKRLVLRSGKAVIKCTKY